MPQHFSGQNFLGSNFGYLSGQLTNQINQGGMSDILRELLSQGRKDIGRQTRGARESIRESGASSGFRGANANLFNNLFESQSSALSKLRTGIGSEAESQKRQAIAQLLGLNQFEGNQGLAGAKLGENSRQFDITTEEGRRQFEARLAESRRQFDESNDFSFGDLLGSILGGASTAATGFGLSRLFKP